MRKLFRAVLVSMAVAAALTGCGGKKSEAPADGGTKKEAAKAADAIEIKVATVGNEKHQSTIAATYFKEKIEELSGGQVKVTIYPNASSGFNEVQKYMVLDGHTYGAESVIMNLDFYNKQSDEVKGWIDSAVQYAVEEQRAAVDSMEAEYMEQIKESGVKVSEPDIESFKEATRDFYLRDEIKELVNPELVELVMQKLEEYKNSGN